MNSRLRGVALLLFGSGLCSLVYQVVWLREMRFIFGASTPASAVVIGIFMGGLGFGSLVLGKRADSWRRPLGLYARLEFLVSLAAALTPLLVLAASRIYAATGGAPVRGLATATLIRIALSAVVLAPATFLMGGTLPAASRAVQTADDVRRRTVAVLYGANTLGAVTGALLPTFVSMELMGTRLTLWAACCLNAAIALVALRLSRRMPETEVESRSVVPDASTGPNGTRESGPPRQFVLASAALLGFSFFLMELVWYRMLGPLLGGSTYTFGLILAVVLLGIGAGGLGYSLVGRGRPATASGLALTCVLEAASMAFPFALGDHLAVFALLLSPLGAASFAARVFTWAVVTAVVVLPASVVAGYQFGLIINLLGRGRAHVGRDVGLGYAWNTLGAIAGALAGGFGVMQLLTAPGTWRGVVLLLTALGVLAMLVSAAKERFARRLVIPALTVPVVLLFITSMGPTAAWRHTPIGAGRARLPDLSSNGIHRWMNEARRGILWEAEGRESSVALQGLMGLSFLINGRSDGSARYDAATQVMCGLLGAILHPEPTKALVIGLGTGSTAGWLADVPTMERVDVAELEPAILRVAEACGPVNRDVLKNPKVNIWLGDAREILLTTPERYDLIVSEPSNPFRAGIASLFTRDYYRAAENRLRDGGVFLQWVQAYEVDGETVRTILATLASVFPYVEVWQTETVDLLTVCSMSPPAYNVSALRTRIAQEPFRSALAKAWRVNSIEGFFSRFVAGSALAAEIAREEGSAVNTDDLPLVEFGFARTVGRGGLFRIDDLYEAARDAGVQRPGPLEGTLDWEIVDDERIALFTAAQEPTRVASSADREQLLRARAQTYYLEGDFTNAIASWQAQDRGPRGLVETVVVADLLATSGAKEATPFIERFRRVDASEAGVLTATLAYKEGRYGDAADALAPALNRYRDDPWPWPFLMKRGVTLAQDIVEADESTAPRLFESLAEPFSLRLLEEHRRRIAANIATHLGPATLVEVVEEWEPHVPWEEPVLILRKQAYEAAGHPLAEQAAADLEAYRRSAPLPFLPGGEGR